MAPIQSNSTWYCNLGRTMVCRPLPFDLGRNRGNSIGIIEIDCRPETRTQSTAKVVRIGGDRPQSVAGKPERQSVRHVLGAVARLANRRG